MKAICVCMYVLASWICLCSYVGTYVCINVFSLACAKSVWIHSALIQSMLRLKPATAADHLAAGWYACDVQCVCVPEAGLSVVSDQ